MPNSGDPETQEFHEVQEHASTAAAAATHISRISVKMPPFSRTNPKLWFLQLESHFHTASIVRDDTKFHHVVSSVETDILEQVMDIVEVPPTNNKYDTLKNKIVDIFSLSAHQKQQRLFNECFLGYKKPSQLLLEMQNLAGKDISESMLKSLWLSRLPISMQTVLAASTEPLSKLSTLANTIHSLPSQSVNQISEPNVSHSCSDIKQEIKELAQEVSQIKLSTRNNYSRSNNYSRTNNYSKSNNYSHQNKNKVLCYYHSKFGNQALKCEKPCSFTHSKNW